MRITEKDIENSCYKGSRLFVFAGLTNRILYNFDKKNLNYLNLKQHLNKMYSFGQYLHLSKQITNYKMCKVHENWDLDFVRYLLNQSIHYGPAFKICSHEGLVEIAVNHESSVKCRIYNEDELAEFLKSEAFLEIFSPNKKLYVNRFMQININSKNPKIVHEESPEFKECAINCVLDIMTELFPEKMMTEYNKLEFTS